MLFQHLYNWIKYKTLPSSFLFKNRLFIERDSKFRRITNNFGLTFRNSKWSNYEMFNLKFKFKNQFNLVIFYIGVFIFFILFYFFYPYYSTSSTFNQVFFIFWFSIDFIDYYFTFFLWLIFIFFTTFFNSIYAYFFSTHVISKKNILKLKKEKKINSYSFQPINNFNLSKKDYKLFIYFWLNSTNFLTKNKILSSLFESSPTSLNFFHSSFFINLYKTVFYLNLFSHHNSFFSNNFLFFYNFSNSFSPYFIFYFLNSLSPSFSQKSFFTNSYSFLNFKYSPLTFDNSTFLNSKNAYLNFFYLSDLNFKNISFYNYFFNELSQLTNNFLTVLNNNKNSRWLYRYSTLHRKTFKNSHKLTLVKKLTNSGFLNTNLMKKNIWNSEIFLKLKKNNIFHSLSSISYPFLFSSSSSLLNFQNVQNLNLFNLNLKNLSFLENSLFWNVKRFNIFNNLKSNQYSIHHNPVSNSLTSFSSSKLNLFIDNINKNFNSFWHFNNNFLFHILNLKILNKNTFGNFNDQIVHEKSFDLFNLDELENINLIINNNSAKDISFLNLLFFSNLFNVNFASSLGKVNKFNKTNKNFYFNFSASHLSNNNYLNDLIYFNFFKKF